MVEAVEEQICQIIHHLALYLRSLVEFKEHKVGDAIINAWLFIGWSAMGVPGPSTDCFVSCSMHRRSSLNR